MKAAILLATVALASAATFKTARQLPQEYQNGVPSGETYPASPFGSPFDGMGMPFGSPFDMFGGMGMGMPFGSPFGGMFGGIMMPVISFIPMMNPFSMFGGFGGWGGPQTTYPSGPVFPIEETTTTAEPAPTEEFTTTTEEYTTTTTAEVYTTTEPTPTTTQKPECEATEVCSTSTEGTLDEVKARMACHAGNLRRTVQCLNKKREALVEIAAGYRNENVYIESSGKYVSFLDFFNAAVEVVARKIDAFACTMTCSEGRCWNDQLGFLNAAKEQLAKFSTFFGENTNSVVDVYQGKFYEATNEATFGLYTLNKGLIPLYNKAMELSSNNYLDMQATFYGGLSKLCWVVPKFWEQ